MIDASGHSDADICFAGTTIGGSEFNASTVFFQWYDRIDGGAP